MNTKIQQLSYDTPNCKYDHVFVICRCDQYLSDSSSLSAFIDSITVVKILLDEAKSILETDRLNNLISAKNNKGELESSFYFVKLGKIPKGLLIQHPCPVPEREPENFVFHPTNEMD